MLAPADSNFTILAWIVLLPAFGALFNTLFTAPFYHRLPKRFSSTVATGMVLISFFLSLYSIWTLKAGGIAGPDGHTLYPALETTLLPWFSVGGLEVSFLFRLDPLSAIPLFLITGIGALIHIYSVGYMEGDRSYWRFFTYLNFFVFSMLVLVLADSLVLLFLGWEGVGVASYLLIGFWYEDDDKATAGKKAFITNRIGDFAVLIGLFLIFIMAGTLNVTELRVWASGLSMAQVAAIGSLITLASILLFIGCTGKSAQIPLYVWLPDAMAGPTPVSALIHAATMVTAGVYLVSRLGFLFALSPTAMTTIALVGGLTAFFAASIGVVQNDIKKVLAYSTVSQLGFMFLAVGVGSYFAGVFHLMTHAFFKALLFLGAGSVIHGMSDEQDIRKMGGLKQWMPITRWTFLIGCLAIAGVPFFSGFFSKDEILWYTLSNSHVLGGIEIGWLLWALALGSAFMTAFYMFRLYFLTFEGECRADEETKAKIHESPISMTFPLMALAVFATFIGFIGIPPVLGNIIGAPNLLHDWLYTVTWDGAEALYVSRFDGLGMAWMSMGLATVVGLSGIGLAYALYFKPSEVPGKAAEKAAWLHRVLDNKYYVDELYQATIGRAVYGLSNFFHKIVDVILIDLLLVSMVGFTVKAFARVVRQFQNGDIQRYAVIIVLGIGYILYFVLA